MALNSTALQRITGRVKRIFAAREDPDLREIIETLKQVSLFRGLSGRVLGDLSEVLHRRSYKRDEFLYYERDPGLGLYIVRSGRVRLLVEDEEGVPHELRQVGEGEAFGKLSLFGDFRRMETAQAITEAKVFGLFRPDLKTIIKRYPGSGAAVLQVLAQNLAAVENEMLDMLVEREGKIDALRMFDGASAKADHTTIHAKTHS
ncbi:MAG: cyclic nucleotide-binding domain-containing protein [Rhodothermales bacterium]